MASIARSSLFLAIGVIALMGRNMPAQSRVEEQVTFTKDVAPILQRACQKCHRPGSIAPMSLLTYEEARPWARAIKQQVSARIMPPWHIDRNVGIRKFKDDPSLSDAEIATIERWVDGGSPRGRPSDMPPPLKFESADVWHIGKPDLIVRAKPHVVPATGSDSWFDEVVDSGLTEDRYLKAVETKTSPEGLPVVHHLVTYLIQDEGESKPLDRRDPDETESFLNEYAVGKNGDIFPDGSGRLVKAGAKIKFSFHLHPMGTEKHEQSEVALIFYPKGYVPKYYVQSSHTGDFEDLDIPAGADNVRADGYSRLTKNARVTAIQPHMHNRGKAQCIEAIYPDGTREMLSCVNRFKFGWHIVYNYADEVQPLLPAGTLLHVISWHDNSAANRFNVDPRNWVGFGQRTIDDMSLTWVTYVWLNDEDFKREVEERKSKQVGTSARH